MRAHGGWRSVPRRLGRYAPEPNHAPCTGGVRSFLTVACCRHRSMCQYGVRGTVRGARTHILQLNAVRRWRRPQLVNLRRSRSKYDGEQVEEALASSNDHRSRSIRTSQIILRTSPTSTEYHDAGTLVRSSQRRIRHPHFCHPAVRRAFLGRLQYGAFVPRSGRGVVGVSRLTVVVAEGTLRLPRYDRRPCCGWSGDISCLMIFRRMCCKGW